MPSPLPNGNPFAPIASGGKVALNPVLAKTADRVIRRVARSERLIPVLGAPGTGKTLLLADIERRLGGRANVQRLAAGDLLSATAPLPEVLLVDEGERADPRVLERIVAGGWGGTLVLACARDCLGGLPASHRVRPETLRALRPREARAFARARLTRGGHAGIVLPEGLAALARASGGNPRALVQLGGAAVFFAQSEGAAKVSAEHVHAAAEMRRSLNGVRPPAPMRRSRRPWIESVEVVDGMRRHRTVVMAGVSAAVVLVTVMFGGFGMKPPVPAPHPRPAISGQPAPASLPTSLSMPDRDTTIGSTRAPDIFVADASPTLFAHGKAVRELPPERLNNSTSSTTLPVSVKPLRSPSEPALALARSAELSAAPPIVNADLAPVPRKAATATLASTTTVPWPAPLLAAPAMQPIAVDAPPADQADRIRATAIAARDAMREMRAGRGG